MADVPSTPADGNLATWLVAAIANSAAPSLATDLAAPDDISCYLTPDGFALTVEQATITDERLCSTETFGQPGRKTYGLSLTGIDNTNSANEATDNVLVDTLVEGTDMFLVRRRGVPFDQALAVGDKVTVIPFKPGVKQDVPMEANSVLRSTWTAFVTASVEVEVAVVA
jgi:hypothetical protein